VRVALYESSPVVVANTVLTIKAKIIWWSTIRAEIRFVHFYRRNKWILLQKAKDAVEEATFGKVECGVALETVRQNLDGVELE